MPQLWDIFTEHLAYSLGYVPESTTNVTLTDRCGLKLSTVISEQGYTGWPNAMKFFIYPMWGEFQSDYYFKRYPDPNDRPNHLSATVFKIKLIQEMWIMFQGIWKQRNNILHNEAEGYNVRTMEARLKRIYTYKTHYIQPTDLELFSVYRLDDALELPPYVKQQWIFTLELAVKYHHKTLDCLNVIPSQCIEYYFAPNPPAPNTTPQ